MTASGDDVTATLSEHEGCTWEQVGLCVYCKDHGSRLYQGDLPASRRTVPVCPSGQHKWDDEIGQGYYSVCTVCQTREWFE